MTAKRIRTEVFRLHDRHISNLRTVISKQQLGLLLGSGVSQPLEFPTWGELVDKLANDSRVAGVRIMKSRDSGHTSLTQLLFQHFRRRHLSKLHGKSSQHIPTHEEELLIKADWRKLIHSKLYARRPLRRGFLTKHPYLLQLLSLVRKSKTVINYNFDNLIEKGLLSTRETDARERGYDSTWRSCVQGRAGVPLIYHPNGFLPDNLLEGPSEDLVFSEDSFADQLIDSMAGHYASILHQLSQHTCLLTGLSLSDPTLRHLLRQHARMNPGHLHYYIAFDDPDDPINSSVAEAVQDANFEVYNLITLFLNEEQLTALLELLTAKEEDIVELARSCTKPRKYVYYITGVPGAGKSTTVAHFTSLATYDEWVDERPPKLAKKWTTLRDWERKEIDEWVAHQFGIRNYRISEAKEGIHVIDRSPLDPLTFEELKLRGRKAKLLLECLDKHSSCVDGQIFVLLGEPSELAKRAKSRHKSGDTVYFKGMQKTLQTIFKGQGAIYIATDGLSMSQVIKKVARNIHLGPYSVFPCTDTLNKYKNRKTR